MFKANVEKIISSGEDRPDLFSRHVLNADGTVTASISGRSINYHDGEKFAACNTTIIPEKNWEFEYAVKKNNFRAYFNDSGDIDNNTLASFEIINSEGKARWINYKLFGAAPTDTQVTENVIKWSNVFAGIDLEYVVDTWRLKENIILKNIEAAQKLDYTFTLKIDSAVTLEQQVDGSILFKDIEAGENLWRIAAPHAEDSAPTSGKKQTMNVRYELTNQTINEFDYTAIRVILDDPEFIENAVYPVVIDPTTDTFNISANGDDGNVSKSASSSYPPDTATVVDTAYALMYVIKRYLSTKYAIYNALLRFDTSSIPDAATITSAYLKLTSDYSTSGDARTLCGEYYSFTSIAAADYTASNSYSAFSLALSSVVTDDTADNNSILLTSPNTNISKTGYTGFRLTIDGGTPSGNNTTEFWSNDWSESGKRPHLTVTYSTGFGKKINGVVPAKVLGVTAQKVNGVS